MELYTYPNLDIACNKIISHKADVPGPLLSDHLVFASQVITYPRFDCMSLNDIHGSPESLGSQVQGCQLSRIIRETPEFEPFLLFSRLESEISRTIADFRKMKFQIFCLICAILLLTQNISSQIPVCRCNISNQCDRWEVNQLGQTLQFQQHLFHQYFFTNDVMCRAL